MASSTLAKRLPQTNWERHHCERNSIDTSETEKTTSKLKVQSQQRFEWKVRSFRAFRCCCIGKKLDSRDWTLNRAIEARKRPTLTYWLIRWSVTPDYQGMFRFIKILELNKKWKKLKRSYGVLDIVLGPRSRHLHCHILHVCYSVLTGQKTCWSPLNSFDFKVSNHVM